MNSNYILNNMTNTRLDNMANIKEALDIETTANRDAFIREGISGLNSQKQYWQSTPAQQEAYDALERDTLSSAGIPTSKDLKFTFSRAQWDSAKGGKHRRKSRKSRKSRRRRTNKRRR